MKRTGFIQKILNSIICNNLCDKEVHGFGIYFLPISNKYNDTYIIILLLEAHNIVNILWIQVWTKIIDQLSSCTIPPELLLVLSFRQRNYSLFVLFHSVTGMGFKSISANRFNLLLLPVLTSLCSSKRRSFDFDWPTQLTLTGGRFTVPVSTSFEIVFGNMTSSKLRAAWVDAFQYSTFVGHFILSQDLIIIIFGR